MKNDILVLDIETGGWSRKKNAICEIGVQILGRDLELKEQRSWIIKPYIRCTSVAEFEGQLVSYKDGAMKVHGITMEQIEAGTEVEEVLEDLINEIVLAYDVDSILGHNLKFDIPWVKELMERFGYETEWFDELQIIDTLVMARDLDLPTENNKLPILLEHFGISNEAEHRAIGDVSATVELYKKLLSYGK